MSYRSGPADVQASSHGHSSGSSIRRSYRRSALGFGRRTEESGSRDNLLFSVSQRVKPLIAVRSAWIVRAERPFFFS